MRLIGLGIFVFFFVAVPMYLLNALVIPELQSLKQTYVNAGATANAITETTSSTTH